MWSHRSESDLREGFPVTGPSWVLFKIRGKSCTFLKAALSSKKTDPEQSVILTFIRISSLPEKI